MPSNGKSNAGIVLGVLGAILCLVFVVKVTIIGYYKSEFVTYLVIGLIGIVLIVVAAKVKDRRAR